MYNNKKKVIFFALLIILVIAVGIWVVLSLRQLTQNQPAANLPPPPKYEKTDLPVDKLPEIFPKDLIQEKDVIVLENFEYKIDGAVNATRKYLSKKSVQENFALYLRYFSEKKWKIFLSENEENLVRFTATPPVGSSKFFLDFSKNSDFPDLTLVEIVYTP